MLSRPVHGSRLCVLPAGCGYSPDFLPWVVLWRVGRRSLAGWCPGRGVRVACCAVCRAPWSGRCPFRPYRTQAAKKYRGGKYFFSVTCLLRSYECKKWADLLPRFFAISRRSSRRGQGGQIYRGRAGRAVFVRFRGYPGQGIRKAARCGRRVVSCSAFRQRRRVRPWSSFAMRPALRAGRLG